MTNKGWNSIEEYLFYYYQQYHVLREGKIKAFNSEDNQKNTIYNSAYAGTTKSYGDGHCC